ncbi:PEP-CTERM sorting domain-containing protein [Colwellia echini]|uniref:PEP-CTERM sorting domain-containing protein n=1 Tax=Colwellia echini TaxID=1982103 RepID=A0ABY3MUU3_9GAMM|nr:PEP-CTERM sorting domain-containing protein [Colwellia echini]TYK64970.1 PEP-CTERM sorting domain-containing protein [Colwellia echini]
MKKIFKNIATAAALTLFCASASATIIFEDDFNRADSNTVGNGWSTIEDDNNDVAIVNGALRLRDFIWFSVDAEAAHANSTESFKDIYIDFSWDELGPSDSNDTLSLSWSNNGTNWNNLWTTGLGGSQGFESVSVGAITGADDLSTFTFRFSTDVTDFLSGNFEGALIDNVVLRGTALAVPAVSVPEPLSIALLGLGLAGIGLSRRKKSA